MPSHCQVVYISGSKQKLGVAEESSKSKVTELQGSQTSWATPEEPHKWLQHSLGNMQ